jgi:hypothetical protein
MTKNYITYLICAGVLSGCAGQEITRTGFLKNYEQLGATSQAPQELVFSNQNTQKIYSTFIVDDVAYLQGENSDTLTNEQITKLKDAYREYAVETFSKKYTLVNSPDANTMRLRLSITGVSKSLTSLNYLSTLALLTPVSNGGISTESEVQDALNGERLAALSTFTNPTVFDGEFKGYYTQTGLAKSALKGHAERLYQVINSK